MFFCLKRLNLSWISLAVDQSIEGIVNLSVVVVYDEIHRWCLNVEA